MSVLRIRLVSILGIAVAAGGTGCAKSPWSSSPSSQPAASPVADTSAYKRPAPEIVRLLTELPPPTPLVHTTSGQVALLYPESVIRMERLARPRIGLAGHRFDPGTRTAGVAPMTERVEILRIEADRGGPRLEWKPGEGQLLDHVSFSPDGRHLSALLVSDQDARLAIFDLASGSARVLDAFVNSAWGAPCSWVGAESLVCRLVPRSAGAAPALRLEPNVIERFDEPAPTRTYSNLLERRYHEELFEHYFAVELARVRIDGQVEWLGVTPGLIKRVTPSPDGSLAVITRIVRPYSHLVPASQFPSTVELWNLAKAERLYASSPSGFDIAPLESGREDPRRVVWKQDSPRPTLGFIERTRGEGDVLQDRWMVLESPFSGKPQELIHSDRPIVNFGWTTASTPYYSTATDDDTAVEIFIVTTQGPQMIWRASTENAYENPGRAIRVDGQDGPVLEVDGKIFLAGDGLGADGPAPFLDVFDLKTRKTERAFSADPGVFEVVLAVVDAEHLGLLTSRQTETEAPNLFLVRGSTRLALRPAEIRYPDLVDVTRRQVRYQRADGIDLSGSLYLPRGWKPGDSPLPTLVWIYPHEFSDRDQAEQLDVRGFQFHKIKGPSPLAAVVSGYAVLLNPTVPILYDGGDVNDDYLAQLVSSANAAVDHLVSIGVAAKGRVAVGGRSYGAFSSANLLIHSDRFATAIAMSGAYNRTLTPFGFQHEKRSFWEATGIYTTISPFFYVDRVKSPILLVHGGADENPGTPTLQTRRFVHALVGVGASVRFVELPDEGHHYWARESVLHAAAEMIEWLDRTIGPAAPRPTTAR